MGRALSVEHFLLNVLLRALFLLPASRITQNQENEHHQGGECRCNISHSRPPQSIFGTFKLTAAAGFSATAQPRQCPATGVKLYRQGNKAENSGNGKADNTDEHERRKTSQHE